MAVRTNLPGVALLLSLACSGFATPDTYWCRKTANRQCMVSRQQCESRGECVMATKAWCFESGYALGPGSQMICVAHQHDCESWRSQRRSDVLSECLQRGPAEYPSSQR